MFMFVSLRKQVEPNLVLEDVIKLHDICKQHGAGKLRGREFGVLRFGDCNLSQRLSRGH